MSERRSLEPDVSEASDRDIAGDIYALALVQFAIIALGIMAITILTKVEGGESGPTATAVVLTKIGLWAFLLPLTWTISALGVAVWCSKRWAGELILSTGCVIVLLIVGLLVVALV